MQGLGSNLKRENSIPASWPQEAAISDEKRYQRGDWEAAASDIEDTWPAKRCTPAT